ncbi:MAG: UTP--glucose-1-phosphate uridylyltransferase [Phycisphaerales bacterium]
MTDSSDIRQRLERIGQAHLLRFTDRLTPERLDALLRRIADLDRDVHLDAVPDLVERYVRARPEFAPTGDVAPAPYYPHDPASAVRPWDRDAARRAGETLIRDGKVAAFTVAGGQGTRLGFDGPKGCYPGGAVTGKPLFRCFAEWILAAQNRWGATIPWYVMTSPMNHEPTVAFFREQGWFGLDPKQVRHFPQGVMPSFEMETGRILLADLDEPATNPDGHGGSLKALAASGAVADMRSRGVEHLCYAQVDNPLVRFIDPVFIGLHAGATDSSAEMSSKMLEKTEPGEKVGVFARVHGRISVIEYSDLPADLSAQRRDDGKLVFNAGNPAIHMLGVGFLERLNNGDGGFALPFHRAEKKVAHIDLESGGRIEPDTPNAIKLETFVFDALPICERSIVLEVDRVEEFAPIKNATGADSVESSRRLQTERAARWLEAAGVSVPRLPDGTPDCTLEISPLTAMAAGDLSQADLPTRIDTGASLAL